MTRNLLLITLSLVSSFSFGQYCLTGGPSQEADSNLEWLNLTGTTGSISFTGCNGPTQGVTGVEEYLTETAYLNAGGSYSVSMQFGTCGGNYASNGQAWIDYNANGLFEASESIGTWTGTPPTLSSTFPFTVPGGAFTGQTRMRVMQAENSTLPLDPCAAFTWGSVTDFSIYIQNGVDCSGYTGDDETDPREVLSLPYSETHSNSICYSNQNPVYNSPDVYYLVIPGPSIPSLDISLCGSSFDTHLSVMDTDGNIIAINDDYAACGTQSALEVSTAGHDSLYVIVEGWGSLTGSYDITINEGSLNINALAQAHNINLYPNPATNNFQLTGDYNGPMEITDANGRVMQRINYSANENVDLSEFTPGVYFVAINVENQRYVNKLIVR